MSLSLFTIKNLNCSYDGKHVVLKISDLVINKGKLVVILGVSGSGKSTILEMLGLMNNTAVNGSQISFHPVENHPGYVYDQLWKEPKQGSIVSIRKEHFSFIFQETNLMQNFTAYENACISQMIQGTPLDDAIQASEKMMNEMGLGEVQKNQRSNELSGGQKQRLAFVRAITPSFTVLFGDEPTGNLDEYNSRELMGILRRNIIENSRTAVIVSHNIDLTIEFADQILVITKTDGCGELRQENVFSNRMDNHGNYSWEDSLGKPVIDLKQRLRKLLE
jgi:ABC-type lipoprotein export system ATPase subunit